MFTHAYLGVNDRERARRFWDAAMAALGHSPTAFGDGTAYSSVSGPLVVIDRPRDGQPATASNGATLGFFAKSAAAVDAFHAAGCANGGSCEGAPGVRPQTPGQMYGAYLRDPDGNKICAFAPNPGAV